MITAAGRDSATREFGRRLKAARQAKDQASREAGGPRWTQQHLAGESDIPVTTIRIYEQGRSYPEAPRLARLCQILEVKADWLIPTDIDEESEH